MLASQVRQDHSKIAMHAVRKDPMYGAGPRYNIFEDETGIKYTTGGRQRMKKMFQQARVRFKTGL